jgi:hypothetical protein
MGRQTLFGFIVRNGGFRQAGRAVVGQKWTLGISDRETRGFEQVPVKEGKKFLRELLSRGLNIVFPQSQASSFAKLEDDSIDLAGRVGDPELFVNATNPRAWKSKLGFMVVFADQEIGPCCRQHGASRELLSRLMGS